MKKGTKRKGRPTRIARRARLSEAAAGGRSAAASAVRRRAAVRRARRARPVVARRAARRASPAIPARTRRALTTIPRAGILVAEGDSWFDYPLNDILSMLEDEHGFEVDAVAHRGDTVEDMAYGVGQFDDFIRLLEKILKRGDVPDAILLSGG